LKQCSSCAREIEETASLCADCAYWAEAVTTPVAQSEEPTESPLTADVPAEVPVAVPRRRMNPALIAVFAAVAIGIMSLGLLSARDTAAPTAATAAATAAKSPSVAGGPTTASATQKWSNTNSSYWVGNRRKSVAFELPAENTVSVWMRTVRPALVVRCMGRRTEVFVVTESAMKIEPQSDDHTVTLGFDDGANVTERWPDSEEHDALFARDGAKFAQRLLNARTLRIGYTPHNVGPVVAQFNVAGLAPLIGPAARECGWK
jgi:Type VI secretion system VasI, EvfG, VC_A0118